MRTLQTLRKSERRNGAVGAGLPLARRAPGPYARGVTPRDYLLLTVLGAIWGASFLFIRVALNELHPTWIVVWRVGLGALGLMALAIATRSADSLPALDRRYWLPFCIMALFSGVFPYVLIASGQQYIPSGSAAILNATSPLFSAGLAVVVARHAAEEALTRGRLAGLLLGVAGVALLMAKPAEPAIGASTPLEQFGGGVAILAASACYAITALYIRRYLLGVPPPALSVGQNTAAALMMLPIALVFGGPFVMPSSTAMLPALPALTPLVAVVLLGLLNTSVAYLIYYQLVHRVGATNALSVTYLQPATALVYGALLLGEAVTLPQLLGLAAILAGVGLTTRGAPAKQGAGVAAVRR